MFDGRPPAPSPTPPPPTAAAPKRWSGGTALLLVGVLVGGAIGVGGARALTAGAAPDGAGAAPVAPGAIGESAALAAIKDVLRRANEAQAEALAKGDPTPMRATATAAHYAEMVQINADLANGGVKRIELVKIAFGEITVDGATATATTTETWRTTSADGAVDDSTALNDYTLVLRNGGWTIESNTQPGSTAVTAPTQPRTPLGTTVRTTSRNWSGYVATGGTAYTSVSGTWVVATPDATVQGTDATWVGIGGANTTDLIQAGTEATVESDGTVTYDAWTEMLPQSTRTISLPVKGGDTVSATITERTSGLWLIDLKNVTTGRTFTTTLRYSSSKSSAEWIEEAPSVGRAIVALDRFGTVRFTAGGAVVDGARQTISGANAKAVIMADGADRPLAVPSTLGTDGSSFSVSRTSNPGTDLAGGRSPGRRRG